MSMEISGKMATVAVTPTITAGAYTAGKLIGGLMTFADVFGVKQSGILHGLAIRDKAKQSAAIDVVIFGELPTGTFTDTSTFNPSAADFAKIVGVISVIAGNYSAFSAQSIATVNGIGMPVNNPTVDPTTTLGQPNLGRKFYAVLVSRGTPTYASTSDLTLVAKVLQD